MSTDHRRPAAMMQADSREISAKMLNALRPTIDDIREHSSKQILDEIGHHDLTRQDHLDITRFADDVNESLTAALEHAFYGVSEREMLRLGGHGFSEVRFPDTLGDVRHRLKQSQELLAADLKGIDGLGAEAQAKVMGFYKDTICEGMVNAVSDMVAAGRKR